MLPVVTRREKRRRLSFLPRPRTIVTSLLIVKKEREKKRRGGVSGDHGVSDASKWNIKHGAALLTSC
jgi:hypothetical protein